MNLFQVTCVYVLNEHKLQHICVLSICWYCNYNILKYFIQYTDNNYIKSVHTEIAMCYYFLLLYLFLYYLIFINLTTSVVLIWILLEDLYIFKKLYKFSSHLAKHQHVIRKLYSKFKYAGHLIKKKFLKIQFWLVLVTGRTQLMSWIIVLLF